jgi:carbamoyl-phosphate synthase large subunit
LGLEAEGIPILGTSPDAIDLAEDRERFQQLLARLRLKQPANAICTGEAEALAKAEALGYPLVIRPSYVLGGRSMRIVHGADEVGAFMRETARASDMGPILLDRYLEDAIEVDVDVVADGAEVFVAGIMEHIEEAGIHSGDSACSLPPYSLSPLICDEINGIAEQLARALNVRGLMNLQLAIKGGDIFVLEVNPRASRTVPFVAKAIGRPIAKIAARVMAGEPLAAFGLRHVALPHVAVKEAVFPFARFPGVDLLLGPEMKSTGEVMGVDREFGAAFAKSQLGAGNDLPATGRVFLSVRNRDKPGLVPIARELARLGFTLVATSGTAAALAEAGLTVGSVRKAHEGGDTIVDHIRAGEIVLMVNTSEGRKSVRDSFSLRRAALTARIPYYTTMAGARAMVQALGVLARDDLEVTPLQSYVSALS